MPHKPITGLSSKALHFIALSLQVHIDLLTARLEALDEDEDDDEWAELMNDRAYLYCIKEDIDTALVDLEASLGTGAAAPPAGISRD